MSAFETPAQLIGHDGQELGTSDWLTVDQTRIDGFVEHTGDHQSIHVDVERANEGPFGAPVAHRYLTLSLAPVLLQQIVDVGNVPAAVSYGLNRVRFPAPVLGRGSRIRGHVSLVSATQTADNIKAAFGLDVEIEGGARPALVAEVVVLYS